MAQAVQSLVLFKRHLKNCTVHKSKVPKNARRFWMECSCPIWIYGRTPKGDIVPRQSTGFSDLQQAEGMRDSLLAQGRVEEKNGLPIAECVQKYLLLRAQDLDEHTLGQHKLALERLRRYLEKRAVLYMHQMKVDHLESFKTDGLPKKMASTTRSNTDAKIRCFLRMAYRREWIKEVLVQKVTPVRAIYEQKDPYTDEEVHTIFATAAKLNGGRDGYASKPATFCLLLELMLHTGMRVGDATLFDPRLAVKGDKLWSYTFTPAKRKRTERIKHIEAFLSDDLKTRIDNCDWLSTRGPFIYGADSDPRRLAQAVYERMQEIGATTDPKIDDCRPHRLRDTFAVRALLKGVSLEDVSRLLGHSSVKVTEAYYAKWVTARKRRLESTVAETLMNS
jgi:integrase/recombinase XerD